MRWKKLGLVWAPKGDQAWASSHAAIPTPLRMEDGGLRVYCSCLDAQGRGLPTWVDLDPSDPTKVLRDAGGPLLGLGKPGTFDDNGLLVTSVVRTGPRAYHLYYAGFETCTKVRYRIFTGLAISHDGGDSFRRHGDCAVMDRSEDEVYFRCGAFVANEGSRFKAWYIAGSEWTRVEGKDLPVYEMRTMESPDGIHWPDQGELSMRLSKQDEHGFGRPWVQQAPDGHSRLFYSIRKRSVAGYRLGYAESIDGMQWDRKDDQLGLDISPGSFDGNAIMYSAVLESGGKTYCFYNGNDFGRQGFGVAVLEG